MGKRPSDSDDCSRKFVLCHEGEAARLLRFPVQSRQTHNVWAKLSQNLARLKVPSLVDHEIQQANFDIAAEHFSKC